MPSRRNKEKPFFTPSMSMSISSILVSARNLAAPKNIPRKVSSKCIAGEAPSLGKEGLPALPFDRRRSSGPRKEKHNATISLRSRADEESVSPPISREESIKLPKSAPATRTESITLSELLASRPVYSTYHDSLLNSQVLKDLEYIPENNSMCHSIPISNQSQSFLLKPHHEKDLVLVTRAGTKLIATYDSSSAKDKRFLRDGDDNLAAVVLKSKDGDGHYKFKIFGGQALFPGQRSIGGMGLYKWADVKKSTGLGMQFTMRAKSNPDHPYVSEHYGPSLFKRDTTRRRGFDIKLDQETIVEVTNLGDVQGLALGPEVDPCLMVCFIAIIDEMFKKRIR